jgi:hypothetical protein
MQYNTVYSEIPIHSISFVYNAIMQSANYIVQTLINTFHFIEIPDAQSMSKLSNLCPTYIEAYIYQ